MNPNRELTEAEKKAYVETGYRRCPFCGSGEIDGGAFDVDCNAAEQEVKCRDCDREWYDVYKLSGIKPVAVADDTENCPKSPDGEHSAQVRSLSPATGYDPAAEDGIVFVLRCRHCGAQGAGKIALDAINW